MSDWETIETAVVAWLESQSGCPVVITEREPPPATFPYLGLEFQGPARIGIDEIRTSSAGEDVAIETRGQRQFTAIVDVFSSQPDPPYDREKSAMYLAAKLQDSLGLPAVLDPMREAGLSFVGTAPVENPGNTVEDDALVERRKLSARFAFATSHIEFVESIATVDVAEEGGT